jgi:hypothetical protein
VQRALDTSGRGAFEHFLSTTHKQTIKKRKKKKRIIISKGSYLKSRCACFFFVCSISRDIVYVCFLLFVDFFLCFV